MNSKAAKLKEEGNKLFVEKNFTRAAAKYAEAIAEGDANAVLYANRAACHLSLRRYLDASSDAKKATQLDPLYSKAWARLATAEMHLGNTGKSAETWKRAIDTLPKENLTPAELTQREQYEDGLKAASLAKSEAQNTFNARGIHLKAGEHKLPWQVAVEMRQELQASKEMSSAWVIAAAYDDFSEGVRNMKLLKKVGIAWVGMTGALARLSNGIMRDTRVFHLDDSKWFEMYNNQIIFEAQRYRSWTEGGPELIVGEAQKRLRSEGWDSLRPALATTIRGYVMRGFLEGSAKGNHVSELEMYTRCIEILEWGQKAWPNVSCDDKGTIFDHTFVRGIRKLRLEALVQGHGDDPGPNSKVQLQVLLESADEALRELEEHPLTAETAVSVDPGFFLFLYILALLPSTKGFYHVQMAKQCERDEEVIKDHIGQAAQLYEEAALLLPVDDEMHAYYLQTALFHYFNCGTRLRDTMKIMEKIRLAIPKMSKIWGDSQLAQSGMHDRIKRVIEIEKMALESIEKGEFTLDDPMAVKFE